MFTEIKEFDFLLNFSRTSVYILYPSVFLSLSFSTRVSTTTFPIIESKQVKRKLVFKSNQVIMGCKVWLDGSVG